MTVEYIIKSPTAAFGLIVVKPDAAIVGKARVMIFCHGIGQRGTGTLYMLQKLYNFIGFGVGSTYPYTLVKSPDFFNCILIFVQTASSYQNGEIQYAIKYAIDNLNADPDGIGVCGHSLGGFGMINFCKDKANTDMVSFMCFLSSGPAPVTDEVGINIVASKVAVWLVHSKDDTVVGSFQSQRVMDSILKADPSYKFAKFSNLKTGGHTGPVGIMFNNYGDPRILPGCSLPFNPDTAEGFNDPGVGMFQYFLMTTRGTPVEIPPYPYTPPVPVPVDKLLFTLEVYESGLTKKLIT